MEEVPVLTADKLRASKVKGKTEPRLYTKPLRKLTRRTSLGFEIIEWAEETLKVKLLPWQKWLIIAAHEYLPGGRDFRFRKILFLAARQNGKSTIVTVLSAYWMTHGHPKVLYSSASLETASDQWEDLTEYFNQAPEVFGKVKENRSHGHWGTDLPKFKASYKVITANRKGGRGKPGIHRVLVDELREHFDFEHMSAVESTMLTAKNAQIWMLSNAGDRRATVLNYYRELGQSGADPELGYFEWSAHEDAELDDIDALAQANPGLGYTIDLRALASAMTGPAVNFKTENMCIGVPSLSEFVSPDQWQHCYDPGTLERHRNRVILALDVSQDSRHVTLMSAANLTDGRVRVETVDTWESPSDCLKDLEEWVTLIKPRSLLWIPRGPSACIATDLEQIKKNVEVSGTDAAQACQEFAELVRAGRIAHNGDEMLTGQIVGANKIKTGDGWKLSRKDGWCDAGYATVIAVQAARKIPAPPRLKVLSSTK